MKEVSASTVRASLSLTGKRGRISKADAERFNKANKGKMHYTPQGEAEKATVVVPGVVMLDKAGRKVTKSVTITTEQARTILGDPSGKRGRLPKSTLALALGVQPKDVAALFN